MTIERDIQSSPSVKTFGVFEGSVARPRRCRCSTVRDFPALHTAYVALSSSVLPTLASGDSSISVAPRTQSKLSFCAAKPLGVTLFPLRFRGSECFPNNIDHSQNL